MDSLLEFCKAALPWVLMGLLVAVIAALVADQKKKGPISESYGAVGMCLGVGAGGLFGSMFDQLAIGIPLGMLFGFAIGLSFKKPAENGKSSSKNDK